MPSTGGTAARRWNSNRTNSAAVGVWATSTRLDAKAYEAGDGWRFAIRLVYVP